MNLSFIKKEKNEIKDTKYFIPCYDIINNEIYFSEFFTDEIISSADDIFDKDTFLSKQKEENVNRRRKEIGTIKLNEDEKKVLIQKKLDNLFLYEYSLRFKKMQIISRFNINNYLSPNYINYFSRPLFSRFFHSQNKDLFSSNDSGQIPSSISSYSFVDVSIDFHLDSLLDINLDKYFEELNENNNESDDKEYNEDKDEFYLEDNELIQFYLQLKSDLSEYKSSKKVSLFYIADSLVKDSVQSFEDIMNTLIYKCEENLDNIDEVEIKEMLEDTNTANEEYEKKLIELLSKFKKIKDDKNKVFVLKVVGYEEYLYGEKVLGNYDFIGNKVRQKEVIKLILKCIPKYKIRPPNFNFPPVIKVDKIKDITYNELFNLYKKIYTNNDIIYRLYKPSRKQKLKLFKKNIKRTKYLKKFTESGDCDFPLTLNINSINNIFGFIKWFNSDSYCDNKLILPYFNPLKTIRVSKTNKIGRILKIIKNSFFAKKEEKNENNKEKKEEDPNEYFKDKLIKKYENIKKDNKEVEQKLNYYKMKTLYQKENYASILSNIFSKDHGNYNAIFEQLQKKNNTYEQSPPTSDTLKISTSQKNNINSKLLNPNEEEIRLYSGSFQSTLIYNNNNIKNMSKFKPFILDNHPEELIKPVFIRIKIYILYGSYCLYKLKTQPYLLKNLIELNEKIIFNDKDNHCLISHLPYETRIGIRIKAYDQKLSKGFSLGSCQIPLYNDFGEMQKGKINFFLWPNSKVSARAITASPFAQKFFYKDKMKLIEKEIEEEKNRLIKEIDIKFIKNQEKIKLEKEELKRQRSFDLKQQGSFIGGEDNVKIRNYDKELEYERQKYSEDTNIINMLYNNKNKQTIYLWEILKIEKYENLLNIEKEKMTHINEKKNSDENNDINTNNTNNTNSKNGISELLKINSTLEGISLLDLNNNKIEEINKMHMNEYPYITINFPKFAAPLVHSITCEKSFRLYLDIKYKNQNLNEDNDYDEIRKLFGNSQKEIKNMINNFEINLLKKNIYKDSDINKTNSSKKNHKEKYPSDLWKYLKKSFSNIIKILKKDPLEKLEQEDIISIIICRDYICTIPSSLELFLRAIDWRNPLEVSMAYSYLKKWEKIDFYDALSLLDARFPDTRVRKYAVDRLNKFPDSIIEICMPMLCQCLLYENFLVNPLADFLIERSLKNKKLIGYEFIWYNRVNMENPFFKERLSAYTMMFLMMAGNKFVDKFFNELKINYFFEITQSVYFDKTKEKKKTEKEFHFLKKYFNEKIIKNKKFRIPLNPSFVSNKINKINYSYIEFFTRESNIIPIFNRVILQKDTDSRQESFIVQILKIIDNLWLKNNLDLKLITYKVFPIELNMGYLEYVYSTNLYNIKNSSGVGGTLDREIIIKHLRCTSCEDPSSSYELTFNEKTDNFIKSLAGYCVVTCVLGIANRVTKNLLIKNNGIFLHVDFGRILGNFKRTLGIKKERTKFLLTPEMANVYIFEQREIDFKKMCAKAFNILRHNASRLINLFFIMSASGMTGFLGIKEIEYIKEMLVLETPNDEDAGNYFIEEIRKCKNERLRQLDFFLQNLKL